MPPRQINIHKTFDTIREFWDPHVIAELNGQHVRAARLKGEFVWHQHPEEDEMFLVIEGALEIDFREDTVTLGPGDSIVVPKGVEHRPRAVEEARVLLFEPAATVNTGDTVNERTRENLKRA